MVQGSHGDQGQTYGLDRFEQIFDQLPIPCITFDLQGRIVNQNRAGAHLLAIPESQSTRTTILDVLCDNEAQSKFLSVIIGEAAAGIQCDRLEWNLSRLAKHLICSIRPLFAESGKVVGGVVTCLDVTALRNYEAQIADQLVKLGDYSIEIEQSRAELGEANNRLQALATTDSLTGLMNRRAFQDTLQKEIKRASRQGTPLSLTILDVDAFKQYNDDYGHLAGDEVLRHMGALLRYQARETDTVARFGGEEFVAIMPGAPIDGSLIAAERFRSSVETHAWPRRSITASFGVSTFVSGMSATDLINSADEALYVSKSAGKNRVTHGNPEPLSLAA